MKVCLVSSVGGHLRQLLQLQPVWEKQDAFLVINDPKPAGLNLRIRKYIVAHSERDWKFFVNLWEAWCILRAEQPDCILSTGAGPAVPFALVGKLFGIPTVFVETLARVRAPSLTGRIMYRLADRFFYQWKSLEPYFPKATYGGPLL